VTPAEHAGLSKPFDRSTQTKARALAAQYRLVIERDGDDFIGSSIEMPLVMGGGDSIESCAADTIKALTSAIATIIERGETPPAPAREGKRDVQLNVRLTADERSRLDAASSREGFRSISDFVRAAALDRSR